MKRLLFLNIALCLFLSACKQEPYVETKAVTNPDNFHHAVKNLSDIIVHDILSPPVASRVYAYPSIAAYEVLSQANPTYNSLAGQLTDLSETPKADTSKQISYSLAAIHAFNLMGKELTFSEARYQSYMDTTYQAIKKEGMPGKVYKESLAFGEQVYKHISAWAAKDNYHQTRSFPKFSINQEPARWKPTPPGYMDGIEPHWKEIRPFVIKDSDQFVPEPPTAFSTDKNSKFYKETMEVLNVVKNGTEEEKEIASFWDCNPYVLNVTGHVMFATKKITPGGHWMGIIGVACKKAEADLMTSIEAYALTSIALADGFISCWDEKYRSNLTRPETVINEYFDEEWVPLLQTPPFPEHTSGHSVISRAAAVALTSIFGDNFSFDDTVEVEYGLPMRSFRSFFHASEEAAVSRLYGGIHFRPAIDEGVKQGEQVGNFVVANLKLRS
jgi:hypothetical protein